MAGNKTGIIGSEFPLLNYIIYLFSSLFGYAHWYGRLINLAVSSVGLYYFYKIIKELLSHKSAFNSTIILTTSIWFAFSRKSMPDTFSISLVIIGIYYGLHYLKHNALSSLLLYFMFSTLGVLCKIPALSLLSTVALVPFMKSIAFKQKTKLLTASTISFGIVCWWYFYWVPHLVSEYKFQLYFPKGLYEGIKEIKPLIGEYMKQFYFNALHSYIAIAFIIAGIVLMVKEKKKTLLVALGLVLVTFVVFTLKTGAVFPLHNYYIIPFAPLLALFAGHFIAIIPNKIGVVLLFSIAIEGIANQQHDFNVKSNQWYKVKLEQLTEKHIPKDALIVINGGLSPQDIYFANRKGWSIYNDQVHRNYIDSLKAIGAEYLIIDKVKPARVKYPLLFENEYYQIFKLTE